MYRRRLNLGLKRLAAIPGRASSCLIQVAGFEESGPCKKLAGSSRGLYRSSLASVESDILREWGWGSRSTAKIFRSASALGTKEVVESRRHV